MLCSIVYVEKLANYLRESVSKRQTNKATELIEIICERVEETKGAVLGSDPNRFLHRAIEQLISTNPHFQAGLGITLTLFGQFYSKRCTSYYEDIHLSEITAHILPNATN